MPRKGVESRPQSRLLEPGGFVLRRMMQGTTTQTIATGQLVPPWHTVECVVKERTDDSVTITFRRVM